MQCTVKSLIDVISRDQFYRILKPVWSELISFYLGVHV